MKSFAYLVPRVFIVALCLLAAVLGADPIVRYLMIGSLQSEVGAEISISKISSDLRDGKIYLSDFSVADPDSLMENLFQADLTYLNFDRKKLLDRQFIVTQARTSHVRFGAPRTQSGALPGLAQGRTESQGSVKTRPEVEANIDKIQFQNSQSAIQTAWLDQFDKKLSLNDPAEIPVTLFAVAKATNERWNRDFELHRQQLKSVNQKIVQLVNADPQLLEFRISADGAASAKSKRPVNPLRKVGAVEKVPVFLNQALSAIDDLKRQQLVLQHNANADIEALDAAFELDIAKKSAAGVGQGIGVNPDTVTNLLLAKFHQQSAADAIKWMVWLQAKHDAVTGRTKPSRGVNFFQDSFAEPSFVIEKIEIDGEGNFANEHFHFAGHALNLSNRPAGYDHPARFELRAQGERHFHINCEMDRRGDSAVDRLVIESPSFNLGEQVLGNQNAMLVSLSPGTQLGGRIELASNDGEITGAMVLDFSNVALVVQGLNELAGGKEIEVRLNHQLSTLNQFQTRAKITGKKDALSLELHSDLGTQIAEAMESVSDLTQKNALAVRHQKIEDFYRTHVRPLQENIQSEVDKISGALNDQISQTENIQRAQRTAAARWPAIR